MIDDKEMETILDYCGNDFKAEMDDANLFDRTDVNLVEFTFEFDIEDNYLFKICYHGVSDERPLLWNYPGLEGYLALFYALDKGFTKVWLNIYDPSIYEIYYMAVSKVESEEAIWMRSGFDYGCDKHTEEPVRFNKRKTIDNLKKSIQSLFTGELFQQVRNKLKEECEHKYLEHEEYEIVARVIYFYKHISKSEWIFGQDIKPITEKDLLDESSINKIREYENDYDVVNKI